MPEAALRLQKAGMLISVVHKRGVTGELRNAGCQVALGDIIVHFDDDDWQGPERVERQVEAFKAPHIELVCSDNFYCLLLDENPIRAQRSVSWDYEMFMQGCSFAYRRTSWKKHPFARTVIGEDQLFAKIIRYQNRQGTVNQRDASYLVYVRHGKNTCPFDEIMRTKASVDQLEWVRALMGERDYQSTLSLVLHGHETANELR